jgi:hypothetical protein
LPSKSWKNHPQKLLRKTQIHFFPLTASTAQMAQTEEFMFQNVAYIPTVYRTGTKWLKKGSLGFKRYDSIEQIGLILFGQYHTEMATV